MTDLYHDINPVSLGYSWKDISNAVYPKHWYTNKSMCLFVNPISCMSIAHYCILDHDRSISWSNPIYREYSWKDISNAVYPNLRYTNKSMCFIRNPISCMSIAHYCILDHDRSISWSNPIYREYSWKDISIAVYPKHRYTDKSMCFIRNLNSCWYIDVVVTTVY